jgi:hypothetical protein
MKTASLSPPSDWPVQDCPRSYTNMPPSKLSPAAIVCTAPRAEVPEEAGMLPPEAVSAMRVAEAVVKGALTALEALAEPELELVLLLILLLLLSEEPTWAAWA